jgi:hypothetical protein
MRTCLLPLVVLAFAAACGGGGGGPPTSQGTPGQVTLIESDHVGIFKGQVSLTYVLTAEMGDDANNQQGVVLFQFPLATIPANAQVTSALLTLHRTQSTGNAHSFGDIVASHIDWPLGQNATPNHFDGILLAADFGACVPGPLPVGAPRLYTLQVGSRVQTDLTAGRDSSAFRFRFDTVQSDGDNTDDRFVFEGWFGQTGTFFQAEIEVDYLVP